MKKHILFLSIFFLFFNTSFSQIKAWKKISRPEKIWVITHPFKAKRALNTTKFVISVCNENDVKQRLDTLASGGKLDAFRHIFWMACLTKSIGAKASYKLGIAHEKGNFIQYKNAKKEDGELPDYASSKMDSLNNMIGINIGNIWRISKTAIDKNEIIKYINNGTAYVIKRNFLGKFITCNNEVINADELRKWNNNKCVVKLSDWRTN